MTTANYMKCLLLIVICFPQIIFAQFVRGDKFIGGTIDFHLAQSSGNNPESSVTEINNVTVQPYLGFLLNEKTAAGVVLGYRYTSREFITSQSGFILFKDYEYSIGGFLTRFIPLSDKFWVGLNGSLEYAIGISNTLPNTLSSSDYHKYSLGAKPALIYFPSLKWGIEGRFGSLALSHQKFSSTGRSMNLFDFGLGTISLGIAYYFRKK